MNEEFFVIKYRSICRKLRLPGRKDSFPFISGDAFRIRCQIDLTRSNFRELQDQDKEIFLSVFLPVGKFDTFMQWLVTQDSIFKNWNLIIHNGDFNPDFADMKRLSIYFKEVFAVNWIGSSSIATAIPIGLENRILRRNGIPWEFKYIRKKYLVKKKRYLLLVAFKRENNLNERGTLAERFKVMPGVFSLDTFLAPFKYKRLVAISKYVLSPPGNGIDCHRTWEALYLNSTPIVQAQAWPFAVYTLPVMVTEDWKDLDKEYLTSVNYESVEPIEIWNMFMIQPFQKDQSI